MLFGFYLLSLFAIRTQLRAKVLLFGEMITRTDPVIIVAKLKKKVFAAIAKTRLKGFSDKIESTTDKIENPTDKIERVLTKIENG